MHRRVQRQRGWVSIRADASELRSAFVFDAPSEDIGFQFALMRVSSAR